MSSDVAIRARGVGKCYALFDKPVNRLKQMLVRGRRRYYREHWAVRGVDFEIRKGETVGVVGRNGSGKSTLLQMICGTLEPTEGEIEVHGRIAPLLQLGAGFNPEMTGRENVCLNAAILGLTGSEIDERFDRIAAFADIGPMLEQPVKLYSSGMYARLAFAVAIHVDPEILVVDEALAVGDEAFQARCFGRIRQLRDAGATILFVSHSRTTILELCTRAMLMDLGNLILDGLPKEVTASYQKLAFASTDDTALIRHKILIGESDTKPQVDEFTYIPIANKPEPCGLFDPALLCFDRSEWPSKGAYIEPPSLMDEHENIVNVIYCDAMYAVEYFVDFHINAHEVAFGILVKTIHGHELAGISSHKKGKFISHVKSGSRYRVRFYFRNSFAPGTYALNVGCFSHGQGDPRFLHRRIDALVFRVDPAPDQRLTSGYFDISASAEPQTELIFHPHHALST